MFQNTLISIIIPAYNAEQYIADALHSLVVQTYPYYEAVIIDDGSTDATAERVRPFLSDSRFSYLQQSNQGVSAARNAGIRAASGDWIALLDSDDIWLPDKLEKQLGLAQLHSDASLIFSNGIEFGENLDERPFYAERRKFPEGDVLRRLLDRNCYWASSVMVRRSDTIEAGMFDERLTIGEDYLLWIKILSKGGRAMGVWEPVVRYRKRGGSAMSKKTAVYRDQELIFRELLKSKLSLDYGAVLRRSLARAKSDQLLCSARCAMSSSRIYAAIYMLKAWLCLPSRLKPLIWALELALPGRKAAVMKVLAKRW